MTKQFIVWDPKDGSPTLDDSGEITSGGTLGVISEDNCYLSIYASYQGNRPETLNVNGAVKADFSLSGSRGTYLVFRVR